MKKLLGILVPIFALQSCAFNANPVHTPPYSVEKLFQAEEYVEKLVYMNWFDLQDFCGLPNMFVYGCTALNEDHSRAIIYMYDNLDLPSNAEIYLHELGHVRDYFIEGRTWEETFNHHKWEEYDRI